MTFLPFQTILVAVDESDLSNTAFTAALRLTQAISAQLIIVHVLNPYDIHSPQPPPQAALGTFVMDESIRKQYERDWTKYVERYELLLTQKTNEAIAAGVKADFIHPQGLAGVMLCEAAQTHDANLIVVGSHQRRGMAEIMLGSTSNYVTHHAPCSVLVVHPKNPKASALSPAAPSRLHPTLANLVLLACRSY